MKIKLLKIFLIFVFFFLLPVIIGYFHIKKISFELSNSELNALKVVGVIEERPSDYITSPVYTGYKIVSDTNLIDGLENIKRYLYILNIQPDIIKYAVYFKYKIPIQVFYASNSASNDKQWGTFDGILLCNQVDSIPDKQGGHLLIFKDHLNLSNQENKDWNLLEDIINDCLNQNFFALQNTTGKDIYISFNEVRILSDYSVVLILKPDSMSKFVIYFGWLISWIGFWMLIIGGPIKYTYHIFRFNSFFNL